METTWKLSIRPDQDSGLPPVDVVVRAQGNATVIDLAVALGRHLAPGVTDQYLVPTRHGQIWPADRRLNECGLRDGEILDVVRMPAEWTQHPGGSSRRRAVLRVVSGPDAGRSFDLATESAMIGRSASCTVSLSDPRVSRQHARLVLVPRPVIIDEGSSYGTAVNGTQIARATGVEWGVPVTVGDTTLTLERVDTVDDAAASVVRPPRFGEPLVEGETEIPTPPTKQKASPIGWAMMLMPLTFSFTFFGPGGNRTAGILSVIGFPLLSVGTYLEQKRRANKDFQEELAIWRSDVEDRLAKLDSHARAQREQAEADHPDLPELHRRAVTAHPLLWTRRESDPDFLAVRVGRGPVPALSVGSLRHGGDRRTAAKIRKQVALRATLDDMPVLVDLAHTGLVAVAGPGELVDEVAQAMVVRLCCDHSPAEVSVTAVLGRNRAFHETWVRWLPHTTRRLGGGAPVAVGPAEGQALLDLLLTEQGRGETICLLDEHAGVPRRAVEAAVAAANATQRDQFGEEAPRPRLHLVWLGDDPNRVPATTGILVDLKASTVAKRDRGGMATLASADTLSLESAWHTARILSGRVDEAALLPADTALPGVIRLPDLLRMDPDDALAVTERWASSRGLRAPIGVGVDGVVTLDLRDDGPHGLVGGTTGSGKSELLQTLICALALNNPPNRMTFLLVDYKGGAAFRECADLPHTVGYITDLTPALVQRALTSLGAEITAREEMLSRFGVKDLVQLEREHPESAPPSLLICVDEFAALTAEVPDFVDGMVNIAQRGRSLGMHLLLATQRPQGVVTPNIRANTDLRIALRMASPDDSNDVIDKPDAAQIPRRTPGRAWVRRTGHGTAEMVQVAWVGAHEDVSVRQVQVDVQAFSGRDNTGHNDPLQQRSRLHPRADLERMVSTARVAFDQSGAEPPARPWIPPLGPEIMLGCERLGEVSLQTSTIDIRRVAPEPGQVPIGMLDVPKVQAQLPLLVDYPQAGHLLVSGASGSGKTELLRTVAVAATLAEPQCQPHIYALDFAGGGLKVLEGWPTVGSVVGDQDLGRVTRAIRLVRQAVTERNNLLASVGAADLAGLAAAGHRLPRLHLLIDNLPALVEALENAGMAFRVHEDLLTAVFVEGRRVGVHVTATTPRRIGVPLAMQAAFGQRLVLRMPSDDDYLVAGVPAGVLTPESPPGRGLAEQAEVQVATIGGAGTPAYGPRLRELAELVGPRQDAAPPPVPSMPTLVLPDELPEPRRDQMTLAADADFLAGVTQRLTDGPILIAGRSRSGRSSVLAGLAELAARSSEPPAETLALGAYQMSAGDLAARLADWRPRPWSLLLVDDLHLWEGPAATALEEVIASAVRGQLAIVATVDASMAKTLIYQGGPLAAMARGRRGLLLCPDYGDGALLGVTVPNQTTEPLEVPGRGLWCANGRCAVVQAVSRPVPDDAG
jgi:DNA segregation ATPase FtsK/SpoIIIE, S-DNA-T family